MSDWEQDGVNDWLSLSGAERDVLICLCRHGPTWDGDVPSKSGRDGLIEKKMAAKVVISGNRQGYQAATYKGSRAYRFGFIEPKKNIVRKLLGQFSNLVKP